MPASADTNSEILGLEPAQIIIVGEVHDNPKHHRFQAHVVNVLGPSAVVFEMLTPEQAEIANSVQNRGTYLANEISWESSGWPDWSIYQPVFEAVGNTPIVGMALPSNIVRKAVSDGAAAHFPGNAARFRLNTALLAYEQSKREELQASAHCGALPESMLAGMVEAQRLRDAHFANTALQALAEFGAPVVVIAGTGHARRDWGIPAAVNLAAPDVTVTSIGQFEQMPADPDNFHHINVTEPVERDDPCAVFENPSASDG